VYADIFETLERELGERFAAPPVLSEHVAQGEYGVKSGRGFLELSPTRADELIERRNRAYVKLASLRRELES
jgi:3-hydroxybutyryl-CoA dehydrogenase